MSVCYVCAAPKEVTEGVVSSGPVVSDARLATVWVLGAKQVSSERCFLPTMFSCLLFRFHHSGLPFSKVRKLEMFFYFIS